MRIGIDARWIIKESSGIGQYTKNLIRYLSRHDFQNQYYIFFNEREMESQVWGELGLHKKENFHSIVVLYSVFSLKNQIFMPCSIRRLNLDVFHSTNFMIPLFARRVKTISTIHDLIPFLFPQYAPQSKKSRFYWIYKILMYCIVRRADHIFVDSNHSLKDLDRSFKESRNKTSVLMFGIDPSFADKLENTGKNEVPYILYVGRQDPYKNIIFLIRVFQKVQMKYDPIQLIIAGAEDKRYPEIRRTIENLGLKGKVIITGFLKQKDLVGLYQKAKIFVLPSLYEGFGLPILEAFSAGVPVVASCVASIPEIAGDAAVLIGPEEEGKWVEEIVDLLDHHDKVLQLRAKGFERLKCFQWEKTIQELMVHYEEILKK